MTRTCTVSPSPMKADISPSVADSSGSFVNGSGGNSSSACKGIPTLSAADREAAIEICELREIFYEQQGQTVLAEFMRESRAQLEAARQGVRT